MFSQIAQVFSSSGILLPASERIPVYGKPTSGTPCDHQGDCSCFGPKFEQASAKLELSRQALDAAGRAGKPLDGDAAKQVLALEKRDREVRAHEAAHKASAGGYAKGGAGYEYRTGPDGRQYAVGGHVDIDTGPAQGNPRATLEKAQTVQRAALAPADPSGADRAVAAAAAQMALQARKEMAANPQGNGDAAAKKADGWDPRRAYARPVSRESGGLSVYA